MHMSMRVKKRNNNYQVVIKMPSNFKMVNKRKRKPAKSKSESVKYIPAKQCQKPVLEVISEPVPEKSGGESLITVSEWLDQWYDLFKKQNISVTTQRGYEGQMRGIKACSIAKKRLQDVTSIDVQRWVNEIFTHSPLTGEPLSPKSVKNMFHNFDAAMKKAEDLDMIKKNPCHGVTLPKQRKYHGEVYDEKDTYKLLCACKGTDMEIPITLAVTLGLRRGELLALKWSHIDFKKLTISIKENMVEVSKNISDSRTVTKDPKSQNGTRTLKITKMLADLLKTYKAECMKNKIAMGSRYNPEDYVVCNKNGDPYLPNTFSKKFKRLLEQKNLKKIRFHDLRHTNATIMLKNGISAKEAQLRLGHSDVSVTLGVYSHVLSSMEVRTANKIENSILGKASGQTSHR